MLRGIAAVAVMLEHARAIFFIEYNQLVRADPITTMFYAATTLGHQAVMIFFVMSGFFVGGGVLAMCRSGWDWPSYLTNRFTRLYVVLIPGLALTALWDFIGSGRAPDLYSGRDNAAMAYPVLERLTPAVLAGNMVYLQTLVVPTFGSNAVLWSLSNEFWYYLVFPLLALPFTSACGGLKRYLYVTIGLILMATLLRPFAHYFVLWGLGVVVAILPAIRLSRSWALIFMVASFAGLLLAMVAAQKIDPLVGSSLVALSAMVLIYCLVVASDVLPSSVWYGRVARCLAGFSFTLYISHFPVLAASRAVFSPHRKFDPASKDAFAFAAIIFVVIVYSWALFFFTESHTDRIRKWLTMRFLNGRKHAGIQPRIEVK